MIQDFDSRLHTGTITWKYWQLKKEKEEGLLYNKYL